ncbi:MAG: LEA type 2 family protein [Bacteroidetes bacterium]|nr:LEA type 2 family protein [Bacteroidota bacterium]
MRHKFIIGWCAIVSMAAMSSCKIYAPTFKTVENVRFDKMGGSGIKLGADLVFNNPNRIKVKVTDIAADVIVDKRLVGTIGEKSDILIKQRSDFRVPLGISIKPDGSLLDHLKTVISFFSDKELEMNIIGNVKLKWLFVKKEIPIRYQTKIKASQIR